MTQFTELKPLSAPYPLYTPGSPTMSPLVKASNDIWGFQPGESTWFWEDSSPANDPASESTLFQADWPDSLKPLAKTTTEKVVKVAWDLFCLVIFPLALIRLTLSWLHQLIGRILYPSDTSTYRGIDKELFAKWDVYQRALIFGDRSVPDCLGAESVLFKTPDGVELEGAFIKGTTHPEKVVFWITGAGGSITNSYKKLGLLQTLGVSVFTINPRGVGKSGGSPSHKGAYLDVFAAYEYLIQERNIQPDDIVGYFFSLGGLAGNIGAALIQEKHPDALMKVIDKQSPATLGGGAAIAPSRCLGEGLLSSCLGTLAAWLISLSGWEMDGAAAFKRLKGSRLIIHNPLDEAIPDSISKYKKVMEAGSGFGKVLLLAMNPNPHLFFENGEQITLDTYRQRVAHASEHTRPDCVIESTIVMKTITDLLNLPEPDMELLAQNVFHWGKIPLPPE